MKMNWTRINLVITGVIVAILMVIGGIWLGFRLTKQSRPGVGVRYGLTDMPKAVKPAAKPKKKYLTPPAAVSAPVPVPVVIPAPAPVLVPFVAAPATPASPPALAISQLPAPIPAPSERVQPSRRSIHFLSGNSLNINVLSSVGGGWRSGVRVNGYGYGYGYGNYGYRSRWVPGYARQVCEDRSTGRFCYDTWEPAHYE